MIAFKHLLAAASLLPSLLLAQESIGTLKSLQGQAFIERDGSQRSAKAGDALMPRDRILTRAEAYVSLALRDQSSLSIGPNSDVDLSKYSFNSTTHQGEQQVRLRSGSLSAISGKLAKASPGTVQFNVGTMTLGVRGTQFVAEVQSSQAHAGLWRDSQQQLIRSAHGECVQSNQTDQGCPKDSLVLLPDRKGEVGAITISRNGNTVLVNQAYTGLEVTDAQAAPTRLTQAQVQARFGKLLANVPPEPRSFLVRFAAGSAKDLAPGSQVTIDQIRNALAQWPMLPNVDVIGHTDTVGKADLNDRLSLERAQAAARWLDSFALPRDRLHISGRGERQLLVPTRDETAEPQNRRVEITVY